MLGLLNQLGVLRLLVLVFLVQPMLALAQDYPANQLKDVKVQRSGDATVVSFNLDKPWSGGVPAFLLANPARLIVDLPNTSNDISKSNIDANIGETRSVALAQTANKTRAVIGLNRNVPYRISTSGKQISITFTPNALIPVSSQAANAVYTPRIIEPVTVVLPMDNTIPSGISASSAPSMSASSSSRAANGAVNREVKNIDFRRGEDGSGRLIVDLLEGSAPINVRQQGGRLLLDIENTRLPDSLRRRLDVTDFGTSVQRVSSVMEGANTRFTLEPKGAFEHAAYQTDSRIVVEVRSIKEDPNKLIQGEKIGYKGDKLSLNFQNIDIRSLLQVFADFTNLNIITSDTVQGSITLRLKDVPWDQALDIVMQAKNLDSRKNGNVVLIAPRDELLAKEKLELERQSQLTTLEPVKSEVFQLQYQRAEDIKKMLTESNGANVTAGSGANSAAAVSNRFLSTRGSASADNRTNQLFVTDVASKLDEVRKLLSKVDIAVRQVMIEARIVEASDNFAKNLGVKLGFNDAKSTVYRTVNGVNYPVYGAGSNILGTGAYATVSGSQQGAIDLSSQSGASGGTGGSSIQGLSGGTSASNTNFVNLPAGAISGSNPASIALSLFGRGLTRFINLELSALEADNKGKIVSSPRVVTSDSTKATIQSGTEIPYTSVSQNGTTTIFKKAVLKLEVTPQITPEGNVIMDVEVNKDSRGETTNAGIAIDTKQIKTQVLVENGGTVVIGGIYSQEEANQTSKVPLLGDLPIFGNLFKSNQKVNNRSELLIFLTPRVIVNNNLNPSIVGQQ